MASTCLPCIPCIPGSTGAQKLYIVAFNGRHYRQVSNGRRKPPKRDFDYGLVIVPDGNVEKPEVLFYFEARKFRDRTVWDFVEEAHREDEETRTIKPLAYFLIATIAPTSRPKRVRSAIIRTVPPETIDEKSGQLVVAKVLDHLLHNYHFETHSDLLDPQHREIPLAGFQVDNRGNERIVSRDGASTQGDKLPDIMAPLIKCEQLLRQYELAGRWNTNQSIMSCIRGDGMPIQDLINHKVVRY